MMPDQGIKEQSSDCVLADMDSSGALFLILEDMKDFQWMASMMLT
jgi:hypothetical protein